MKKQLQLTLAALVSLFCAASATAMTITETDTFSPLVGTIGGSGQPTTVSGEFNLLTAGYNPTSMSLTSATVTFTLSDPLGGNESGLFRFRLLPGPTTSEDLATFSGVPTAATPYTFALGTGSLAFLALDDTGILHYRINRVSGQFVVNSASITAVVPDGGATAILLGGSLLGLVAIKRRFKMKAA